MDEADRLRHLHGRAPSLNWAMLWPEAIASARSASNRVGVRLAGRARAAAAIAASRAGSSISPPISAASRSGRERRLRMHLRPAGRGQRRGVGRLVVVERIGIGHQGGRPADHRDLRDRRGAGARDHEMRGGDARRHVVEERAHLGRDAERGIGRAHGSPRPRRAPAAVMRSRARSASGSSRDRRRAWRRRRTARPGCRRTRATAAARRHVTVRCKAHCEAAEIAGRTGLPVTTVLAPHGRRRGR